MERQKKRRALIALVVASLVIALLGAFLFFITWLVVPHISVTYRLAFSVIGAVLLSSAGFLSGLKDTYDLVVNLMDTFFDDSFQNASQKADQTSSKVDFSQENSISSSVNRADPVYTQNFAGRDINIFNFPTPLNSPTTISILSNQIEKLGESVSVQFQQRLQALKNAWREGKKQEILYELQKLRRDSNLLAALSDEVKAEYLCFEGSIELHLLDNVDAAKAFADKANALTSTSNVARLRASIAFTEGKPNEAIELLTDWTDLDSLHLKAALYLELRKPIQCLEILELVSVSSSQTTETYRLRALSYLVTKEISQAQLEIQKALELNPEWESVLFSAALIDFYSAISFAGFDDPIAISAEPISWILIKRDDQSLSKLNHAAVRLQKLMKLGGQTMEETNKLHAWYLACLANHPERQNEAELYCQSLLEENPAFIPAIRWVLARNYKVELDASEKALQEYVTNHTDSVYHMLTLIDCYIAGQRLDKAVELLERKEGIFREQGAIDIWLLAFAQAQVSKGTPEAALWKIDKYGHNAKAYHARMCVLQALAEKTNDWQTLNDFLNKVYNEIKNPSILLDICEIKAEQQEWTYIVRNSEILLNSFETAPILQLIAIAAYNTECFQLCLQLLDNNRRLFPQSRLPEHLRRMRVSCQYEMGILSQAVIEAENLASEVPTLENFIPLADLYIKKGDFKKLAVVARKLERFSDLPPEMGLEVSRRLIWEDRMLALALWEKIIRAELPDELVGEAYYLGNQLGLRSELKSLALRLKELGQEKRGGIIHYQAHELLEMMKQGHEHRATLEDAYWTGHAPIHFVVQQFHVSLAILYHSQLSENEKQPDPFKQPFLLARHGGRMPIEGFPSTVSNINVHLDITALLLAEHLGILSKVEQAFAPLHIPAELIPALIQLREGITPHQPARLEAQRQIVELVNNGLITVLDEELSPEFDNPTLLAEMGMEWVILAETARRTNGFLVDFLPLAKNDLSGDVPSALPEGIEELLVNCRALVESLLQAGPLSIEEYHRALEELGNEGHVGPSVTIPQQHSFLYCDGAIPETLAGAKLLTIVCQRFKVFISTRIFESLKTGLDSYLVMQHLADWIDNLISCLSRGLDEQLYQITPIAPDKRREFDDIRLQHPIDRIFASLLGFEEQQGDVIWTDDRWFNSNRHRDGVPIADVYDVLKFLVSLGQMDEREYYRSLYRLRSSNVLFIPIQRDEIVYHLKHAHTNPTEGTVVETQQMKVLRRYAASCFLRKNIIQTPPMHPSSSNNQGEVAFVINFTRAVSWALFDIWVDSSIEEVNRPILCEWIVNNLYLDYLLIFRAASFPVEGEQISHATLGLITVLVAPFTSTIGYSNIEIQSRKAYFSWLYERLLKRRFAVDPHLLASSVEKLKDTFDRVKEEAQQSKFDSAAIDLLLQTYYNVLPEPIQHGFRNDPEFMSSFGLEFIPTIMVEGFAFEPRGFFQAAYTAINNQKATIIPIRGEAEITLEPIEGEPAVKFTHPHTGEEIRLVDERLILFLDSTIEREQMLYQRRNWFDCSDTELRKAIASILVTEDLFERIQLIEQWRENSTYLYYKNLYQQIRDQNRISFPSLIPPSGERLLSHYRLNSSASRAEQFLEEFSFASKLLINEEGLGTAIHRLVGFPISLPKSVVDEISSLSEPDLSAFVRSLLKSSGSPLSKIHLINILVQLAKQRPSLYRLARRITKSIFTENSVVEFMAFSNLLRWVHQEFGHWEEAQTWQPHIRLAMVWAHAHQLFSIFMAVTIPPRWIADTFTRFNRRISVEIFDRDTSSMWFDLAHPRQLNFPVFTLMGLADSVKEDEDLVFDQVLQAVFKQVGLQIVNDLQLPTWPFFADYNHATNTLATFMGQDYPEKLAHVLSEEVVMALRNEEHQSFANQAIESLFEDPHNFFAWFLLGVIIRDFPPDDSLRERLVQLLTQINFVELLVNEQEAGLAALEFASWQLVHLSNTELNQHLKDQYPKVLKQLAYPEELTTDPQGEILDALSIKLVEMALNIALSSRSQNETLLTFCDLLSMMVDILPESGKLLKSITQVLCEELPLEQGQYFGKLLLRLRTL